jgi:hypothetical protein
MPGHARQRARSACEFDELVDRFVNAVNASERDLLLEREVTTSIAERSSLDGRFWTWSIRRFEVTWIRELESKLGAPFPAPFTSLVSRYIFPSFEVGPLRFFANTPEGVYSSPGELRDALLADTLLFRCLSRHQFVQFARAPGDKYDPVCFDANSTVVRLDHEAILCEERIHVVETIAPTFPHLLQSLLVLPKF